ncbi:COX15/CtaA family protein [Synechococcus sp. CC9605]|uniref:COX15/CtaA family protein n=1 Tax=Synechococcus sp. (strain CC9605) TaxID=110662 RepID=UPI00005D57B4|nr:putative cytochrome c oxidase assembly protein [Synechococcus sp. CC9605]
MMLSSMSTLRRRLGLLSAHLVVAVIALVVIGGATRVMEAGLACPDWPLCFGSLLPGRQMNVQVFLEWFHRLDAFVIGIALVVMAVATTLQRRQLPRWLPWLAVGLMALVAMQGGLGALTVTRLLPSGVVTAHLALALTLVALLSGLTQRLLHPNAVVAPLWWRIGASLGLMSVFVQCLLGGRMATAWAGQRCLAGGEACQLVLSHRLTAMPVVVVVLGFAGAAVLAGGWARQQWPWLGGAVLLVLIQVALGVFTLRLGLSQPVVTVAHQLVAALLIALLSALLVRSPDRPSPSRSVVLDDTSLEACHG